MLTTWGSHLSKLALVDELTGLLNLIQLLKFVDRGISLGCHINHTVNYRFRAAAECITHYCAGNAYHCL